MAVVRGTNAGLVEVAPTTDPQGNGTTTIDFTNQATKITTTNAVTISEIGWWCQNATEEANFEVAIYSHNSSDDVPNASIYKNQTNAKGISLGWKVVTGLNILLEESTIYWIVIQVDNTDTATKIDYQTEEGEKYAWDQSEDTLQDPWNTTSITADRIQAVYAVWEASGTDYTENLSETMTVSDSLSKTSVFNLSLSDTQDLSDSLSKTSIFNIALSETFNLADSLTSAADYNRLLDDIQSIQDSLSSSQEFTVLLTELQSITDTLSSEAQYNRNLDDTINMTDSLVDVLATLARVYREIILKLKNENVTLNQIGTPQTLKLKDKNINLQ